MTDLAGISLEGMDGMVEKLEKLGAREVHFKRAIEFVLRSIANWIKQNHASLGGWQNQRGALHNSIGISSIFTEGDNIYGYVRAGQFYAPYVEFKPNHWVISRGMDEFRPKVLTMMKEAIEGQIGVEA
jgi:hypothetical protein